MSIKKTLRKILFTLEIVPRQLGGYISGTVGGWSSL